jgi:hypothetical protein
MAMESAFDQNLRLLKTKQRFLDYLGNETTAIAFDEWYDTRNTKNLSIQSIRCRSKAKMIRQKLKTFTLIQEF